MSDVSTVITSIKPIHLLLFAVLSVFFQMLSYAEPIVFTDLSHPVFNTGKLTVVYLDKPHQIEQQLSAGLSADPIEAKLQAEQRIQDRVLQQQLLDTYLHVVKAWQLGITKIPAVVDGQFVVYGQADVQKALQQIAEYQQGT